MEREAKKKSCKKLVLKSEDKLQKNKKTNKKLKKKTNNWQKT